MDYHYRKGRAGTICGPFGADLDGRGGLYPGHLADGICRPHGRPGLPSMGGSEMSTGRGIRRRNRRADAEAKWRAYHSRQREIYAALLEEPGACYYTPNLRGMA